MTMHTLSSHGFFPDKSPASKQDKALFRDNAELILANRYRIIATARYFFCRPAFAYCSWPYISGDGPLNLGTILLGYEKNLLTGLCEKCGNKVLVEDFGGSPLPGSNSWNGFCAQCCTPQSGRWKEFVERLQWVIALGSEFPEHIDAGPKKTILSKSR